jgi:hypothetical protein
VGTERFSLFPSLTANVREIWVPIVHLEMLSGDRCHFRLALPHALQTVATLG